jgi:putative hydrolases of HD superfamily
MSILTMLAPSSLTSRLNIPHCTRMALIHDMAESLVGDITPVDGVSKAEKSRREQETMDYLCKGLLGKVDGGLAGEDMRAIWQEYEEGKTLESRFVHDIDKLELVLQMVEYERSRQGKADLGEFTYVVSKVDLPEVKAWCEEVLQERDAFWKTIGKTTPAFKDVAFDARIKAQVDEYYAK